MKFNSTTYILLTLVLILLGCIATYYFTSTTNSTVKEKGFEVSYPYKCSDGDIIEEVKHSRKYKTFLLNSDTINNDTIIRSIRETLNQIKITGDSTNGVHIEFTDNTAYKYYLKTIEICNERRPRLFLPFLNHIYALGKSKFQMTRDSLAREQSKKDGVSTMEITGQINLD